MDRFVMFHGHIHGHNPVLRFETVQGGFATWVVGAHINFLRCVAAAGGLEYARRLGREEGNPKEVDDAYQQGRMAGWDEGYDVGQEQSGVPMCECGGRLSYK